MTAINIIFWWYTKGWKVFINKLRIWFGNIADFFSMTSLIRTLFKPFRQISANENAGSRLQIFTDRLVSRLIGFLTRLVLLIIGLVVIIVGAVFCLVLIIIWPLIPLLPVAGITLTMMGVTI